MDLNFNNRFYHDNPIGGNLFVYLSGGTALLIVVSVVLETWRQLQAQMEMREYERF